MALVPTFMDVTFRDDAQTTRTIRYRLNEPANDDGSNMADVFATAEAVEAALIELTGDGIDYYDISLRAGGGSASIDSSNNQISAFIRTTLTNNDAGEITVPAWDTVLYDMNSQLMLDAAFIAAAETLANLLCDPETGVNYAGVEWAQSRTRKLRGKRVG